MVAPPGRTLVIADFGQIELRVAAELSGDEAMRRVFRDGQDMHTLNAEAFTGMSLAKLPEAERNAERSKAKRIGFGTLYGSGAGRARGERLVDVPRRDERGGGDRLQDRLLRPLPDAAPLAERDGGHRARHRRAALGRRPAAHGRLGGRRAVLDAVLQLWSRARPPT